MARKKKNTTRKDGLIAVQVYLGLDGDGKRKYKTVYGKTQKEAEAKADDVKEALGKNMDIKASERPFEYYAEKWLKKKMRGDFSESRKKACAYSSRFWSEKLNMKISDITVDDIQTVIDDLADKNPTTGKPSSKRTLSGYLNDLKSILDLAKKDKAIFNNPAYDVDIPKTSEPVKRRALTDAEQEWVLNTEHRAKRAAMILMYAGLRRGELIPLTWNDIDLEEGTISVNKSVVKEAGKFVVKHGSAKSLNSIRVVNIPNRLVEYLRTESRDGVTVCTDTRGLMHSHQSWRIMWESYLKEVNFQYGDFSAFLKKPKSKFDPGGVPFVIPRFTPHWLRHTFCTIMYHSGIDILTCQQQMGHADSKTTIAIYTHLDKLYKKKSMEKVDDYLDAKKVPNVIPFKSDASKMQVVNL